MSTIKIIFFLIVPLALALFFLSLEIFGFSGMYFGMLGFLCIIALSPALILKKIEFFEPIVLVFLATVVGGTARAVLISIDGYENYPFIMQGYNLDVVYRHGFSILIGLFTFSIGYLSIIKKIELFSFFPILREGVSAKKLPYVIFISIIVATIGILLYVNSTGIDFSEITNLSNKRATIVGETDVYTSYGYFKMLSAFSEYALYIVIAYVVFSSSKPKRKYIIISIFLVGYSCIIPFLSSSRMDIILILINVAIIVYYGKGKVIPKKTLAVFIMASFLLSSFMGYLRANAQGHDIQQFENPIVSVIASGNFVDIVRYSVIIEEMPDQLDYLHGSSLISWLFAPVPRSIWPEKPPISLGPTVRSEIYELPTRNNGFPPGIIAEGYMNFGYIGIFILPFIFGALLRLLYNSFYPYLSKNPLVLIIYVGFVWRFSFGAIGLNFSQALVQVLTDTISLYLLCLIVRDRRVYET